MGSEMARVCNAMVVGRKSGFLFTPPRPVLAGPLLLSLSFSFAFTGAELWPPSAPHANAVSVLGKTAERGSVRGPGPRTPLTEMTHADTHT
jgi:hypothetical protein